MGVCFKIEKSMLETPGPMMVLMPALPKANGAGSAKALVLKNSAIVLGPLFGLLTRSGSLTPSIVFELSKVRVAVRGCPDANVTIEPNCQPETIFPTTAEEPDQKRCPLPTGSAYSALSTKRCRWSP